MPKFAPKYGDHYRQAVIAHCLDAKPRLTVPDCLRQITAGTLQPDLAPTTIVLGTARAWLRDERARRRTLDAPTQKDAATLDAVAAMRADLLTVAHQRVAKLKRAGARANTTELRDIARAVREIAQIPHQQPNSSPTAPQEPDRAPDTPPDPTEAFYTDLARQHEATTPEQAQETPSTPPPAPAHTTT